MAWNNSKNKKKGRKKKEKLAKKIARAIFGRSLPLVMILVLLLGVAFGLLYNQSEAVRNFVDGLGIFSTSKQTSDIPFIDPAGNELAVHFLDVGQGDATLFQTSEGAVLVDCSESEYADYILEYLDAQGITELEYFIITHPDSDHMGAAAEILRNIKVNHFVMNGQSKTTVFFETTLDVIEEKEIEVNIAEIGDVFTVGALQMRILGPQPYLIDSEEWNEASLIIHATYGHRSFLLTGDAETKGEADLLEHFASEIECDVFSAGHHGSRTSNSIELLEAARPEYVVISCGKDNKHKHPHQESLDNFAAVGATVYRTDELGTIVFITDGETLTRK